MYNSFNMNKPKILFAGINKKESASITEFLSSHYTIWYCNNCVDKIKDKSEELIPDLLIIEMDNENKDSVLSLTRHLGKEYDKHVIVIAEELDEIESKELLAAHPFGIIFKPLNHRELFLKIEIGLRLKKEMLLYQQKFIQKADFSGIEKNNSAGVNDLLKSNKTYNDSIILEKDGTRRIEIVNNGYMKQYWILEEQDS